MGNACCLDFTARPYSSKETQEDDDYTNSDRIKWRREHKGISVHALQHVFLGEVIRANLTGNDIYTDITSLIKAKGENVYCPRDNKLGAAYVDCLAERTHVGPADILLSYTSSSSVEDIVGALIHHCNTKDLNPQLTYVWIHCLCANLHREDENIPFENFVSIVENQYTGLGSIVCLVSPGHDPIYFKRLWCILELFMASKNKKCKITISIPPQQMLQMLISTESIHEFYKAIDNTNINSAMTSKEDDQTNILRIISEEPKSNTEVSKKIQRILRRGVSEAIMEAIASFEKDELDNDLSANEDFTHICFTVSHFMESQEEYESALAGYRICLTISKNFNGENHISTAAIHNNIGLVLDNMGDDEGALTEYKKSLDIYTQLLGKNHVFIAHICNNIGLSLQNMGDFDGALTEFKKSLGIYKRKLGTRHLFTGTTHKHIGKVLDNLGNIEEALVEYKKCFSIRKERFGQDHPETSLIVSAIARLEGKRTKE